MPKKTFYIILAVVVGLLIIGGSVWFFFFKPIAPTTPSEGPGFTTPNQETAKGWSPISEKQVTSARFDGNDILFYDFSGKLWQLKAGYEKPTPADQTTLETTLKTTKGSLSPDNKKIVYQIADSKNNTLFTSDPEGKNQKVLVKNFKLRDVVLKWAKTNQIAITAKPSGLVLGSLWILDPRNLNITKLMDSFLGLETLFAPDGLGFIYSYTDQNGQKPKLGVFKNSIARDFNNIFTLVDKCAWTNDSINIYCAIPREWPDFLTAPDDYYKNIFSTNDDLWKINAETGEKNLIFQEIGDISNPQLSADDSNLIFISRNSQFLYQLNLKDLK